MAQHDRDGAGVPFTGIAVILLIALGFGLPHLGLESTRPQPSHVGREHSPTLQQVPARLWEDPFEAVAARKRPPSNAADGGKHAESGQHATADRGTPMTELQERIRSEIRQRPGLCVSLMPVMVFGGPYGEFAEVRRRTRYAVVSGLLRSGFSAHAEDHIGFVGPGAAGLDTAIPFEWFERRASEVPVRSDTSNVRKYACRGGELALILWLDQDMFEDVPLAKLATVAGSFTRKEAPPAKETDSSGNGDADRAAPIVVDRVRLIGPASSKLLQRMDEENACAKNPVWTFDAPLEMYVWGATAPPTKPPCAAAQGGANGDASFLDMVERFRTGGIALIRTVVEDRDVIARLVDELEHRGIKLSRQHVALVAEADTLYGTKLLQIMEARTAANGTAPHASESDEPPRVKVFNYLRGLDGETARVAARDARRDQNDKDARKRNDDSVTSSSVAQLDYARRIAEAIHVHHDEVRTIGTPTPVIGVLGSDFYDKSLLLQALRKELPQSIFFTTDLDARMTDTNQRAWARNLVVGSGLGLRLRDELQGGVAPFRDNYQTSTFLATLLALNARIAVTATQPRDAVIAQRDNAGLTPRAAAEALERTLKPRAYEIGASEAFDFGPPQRYSRGRPCSLETILGCDTVDPKPSEYVQLESSRVPIAVLIVLLVAALGLGTSWFVRSVVERARESKSNRILLLVTVLATGLYVAWMLYLIGFATVREPFRWDEGFSAWPTLILRSVAAALAATFFYGLARDRTRTECVLEHFGLEPVVADASVNMPRWAAKVRNAWARVVARDAYSVSVPQPRPSTFKWVRTGRGSAAPADAQQISSEYLNLASLVPRLERVVPLAVCYVLLSLCLIVLWDLPNAPVRGHQTLAFHKFLLATYIFLYSLLLFAVVDTVRLSDAWISRLMVTGTSYPTAVLDKWRAELRMGNVPIAERALCDWISIQLIGRHTESTVKLVYYPFVVLAIGLVARSQLFDNWHTPTSLMIIFTVGAAYAVFAAIRLRTTVERARTIALERMSAQVMALYGSSVDPELLKQAEMLVDDVKNIRRGAFTPLAQQPLWKALLLPLSGFGGIEAMQYVWMLNK